MSCDSANEIVGRGKKGNIAQSNGCREMQIKLSTNEMDKTKCANEANIRGDVHSSVDECVNDIFAHFFSTLRVALPNLSVILYEVILTRQACQRPSESCARAQNFLGVKFS